MRVKILFTVHYSRDDNHFFRLVNIKVDVKWKSISVDYPYVFITDGINIWL